MKDNSCNCKFKYTIEISRDEKTNSITGHCPQLDIQINRDDNNTIELFKDVADLIYELNLVSQGIS